MKRAVGEAWLEVRGAAGERRIPLASPRTRLGARGSGVDVELPVTGPGELHVWSEPPKLVHVGEGALPELGGVPVEESPLRSGDSVAWAGVTFVYRTAEEPSLPRAFRRLLAGMLVDLGMAPRKESRRWQEAVVRGEFDADACADELLAATRVDPEDTRLLERAGRLERDLRMSPVPRGARGAARRGRGTARGALAMILSQLLALFVYTAILLAIVVLLRLRGDFSVDALLDRILDVAHGGPGGGE